MNDDDPAKLMDRIDQQIAHAEALLLTPLNPADLHRTMDLIAVLRLSWHHAEARLKNEQK